MILFQKKNKKFLFHKLVLIFFISFVLTNKLSAQSLTLEIIDYQDNTICGGSPCNYEGPTILINEVMLMPNNNDGCIFGIWGGVEECKGEWIELYNPDECNSVDISCYFLGNCAEDGGYKYGAGFALPMGTIVPPLGFCVVRGINAPNVPSNLLVSNGGNTVEVVVEDYPDRVCLSGGDRLWFPNAGGWFAFYDENGVVQDAINWNSQADMDCNPCNPGNCSFTGILAKGDNITNITYIGSTPVSGQTFRRIPDGSNWDVGTTAAPTYGTCNSTCADPVVFTCDGEATVSVLTGTPPYTYLWDNGQIGQTAIGLCAGQHCVTVTDANGSNSICIDINEPPSPVVNLINDTAICSSNSIILDAENFGSTYEWNTGDTTQTITVSQTGNYSVIVTDTNNCTDTATVVISVFPSPNIEFTAYPYSDCEPLWVTFTDNSTSDSSITSWLWDFGDTGSSSNTSTIQNPSHFYNNDGIYDVTLSVTTTDGCTETYTYQGMITVYPQPDANFYAYPEVALTQNPIISFTDQSSSANNWNWNFGDPESGANNTSTEQNPSHTYNSEGIYDVLLIVSNYNNTCFDTIIKQIEIVNLTIPNVFTPNNDGRNDYFYITNIEKLKNNHLMIFNRWGNLVYEKSNYQNDWDGKNCPDGVYYYILKLPDNNSNYHDHGTVTIIR